MKKIAFLIVFGSVAVASQAVTFSNIVIGKPASFSNPSVTPLGNAITFMFPDALVGDSLLLRAANVNIQYDANSGVNAFAVTAFVNLGAAALGSGKVLFTEMVFELDSNGNEVGGPIGTISHVFDSTTSPIFAGQINLSRQVTSLRAKKAFTLFAPDSSAFDLAGIQTVNQSVKVVPEPATIAALGAGVAFMARRRRKSA